MNAAEIVAARRATLSRLRPVKVAAREHSRELWNKREQLAEQGKERAEVRELVSGHAFDLFPTPSDLARRMVALAEDGREDEVRNSYVLEPSAGTGNIAKEIRAAGLQCHCLELSYCAAKYLMESLAFPTNQTDFLTWEGQHSTIIMNPPFGHAADIDHVTHAWNLLVPGGRIVAIMSAGTRYRSDKKTAAFRESILSRASLVEDLPAGTFKESGTNVSSILVVIDK